MSRTNNTTKRHERMLAEQYKFCHKPLMAFRWTQRKAEFSKVVRAKTKIYRSSKPLI